MQDVKQVLTRGDLNTWNRKLRKAIASRVLGNDRPETLMGLLGLGSDRIPEVSEKPARMASTARKAKA